METPHDSEREPNSDEVLATENRRRTERRDTTAQLLVVIETPQFGGKADNLSDNGVFFFSKEKLRVQVHVDDGGVHKRYAGKIVRVQQMNDQETGFAIEFDVP
ncbi:MAG: PilZ domain-containing protein [Planctomycetota bacterium]